MNKAPPNLDLLYDKVLDFNEVHPDEYFDSVLYYLSDNTSQIHNIFDNLTSVFANNPSLLNALKIVLLFVIRLGAPAFFGLEGSRIPELNLDPTTQHDELLELKRIMRYCLEKFQKMQTAHEIPNIRQKYAELCQIVQEEVPIGEIQLTDFEQQYSGLAVKFKQFEQRVEALISESQDNNGNKIIFENSKGIQLLEQINELMIQPEQGFTKSENELILNFFHQKYALITRIYNEFPHIAQEYQKFREEKKAKRQQEKGEEEHKHTTPDSQIQNIKDFTFFVEGTSLAAFPESMSIEYKDYIYPFRNEELKKKLRATICAFLNTNGGRILIGVGNTGFRVRGLFLTTNDQDTLIRDIDALVKDFHPKVDPEEVTSTFIPIKKRDGTYKPGFYIVKILVKRGKPNDLYFAGRDCYKRRNGQNDVQMPGNFKRDILDRATVTIQSHPELFRDRGEFNDPAPELGIPITNVKEKRPSVEIKPVKPIGIKQKPSGQIPSATTKLLVKNVPNKPDIGIELKSILDPIQPLSKTLLFTKDNEVILTFQKIEDTKLFMDYVEGNPIAIGNSMLQFSPKPLDKEKQAEKAKMKVEVEEDKKDPLKAKAESSSIIWVRNIPENTTDLKEKLTAMLGEHAAKLKDIKIHNKKKRATLEFDTSIQANEVLNYLNLTDRFIGEAKVTFEKASPPSSPSQATKSTDIKPIDSTKANQAVKTVEQGKPKEVKKPETVENQVVETNILKISNIPLDEPGQELGYLVRSCNHHIKKAVEKKINKDHVLFYFKDKEDSAKAFNFLVQNNFSFRGKKIRVDYYSPPPPKTEAPKPKNIKSQTSNVQTVIAPNVNVNNQEIIGQGQNIPQGGMVQPIDMTIQNNIPPGIYHNGNQQEMYSNDHLIQQHLQQQQQPQFNPFVFQGNNGYHADPHFYQDQSNQSTAHFNNSQFDPNPHQVFGSTGLQQSGNGNTVDQLLRTTETLEPDSIQFDIQNTLSNPMSQQQQQQQIQPQHQYLPSQSQTGFDPKSLQQQQQQQQQNVGDPQHSVLQTQQSNPNVQDQKNVNQVNAQETETQQQQQQAFQPNENQNTEIVAPGLGQQGFNPGPQQYGQPQFNQSNVHSTQQTTTPLQTQVQGQHNFVQDPKLLNQQSVYQYGQAPQTGGPQQSVPQGNNSVMGGQGPSNTNAQGQLSEQANRPGVNNQIFQNQQIPPAYYSQFPQQQMSPQQINQQRGMQTNNPIQPNGQYPMNNPQQALNKNFPQNQNQYQPQGVNNMQNSNFPTNWQQNQPQGTQQQQQQFPHYPMQQFNQGQQQQYGQQNLGNQFQHMNPQGQFGAQQGQFPTQGGQFPGQTAQYPFQGGNQQTANLQGNKNIPNQLEAFGKKQQQLPQNQLQGQNQNQMQTQGNIPTQQNFGGPSYYSGYPQGHMPGNFPYGQNVGYNQNQNMQNLRPDMMYQNVQGNMQGNLQQAGGNQGLTPQQLQQLQMQQQQMQYGGLQSPQFVGTNNQINMK